jgi:hypothetical protein
MGSVAVAFDTGRRVGRRPAVAADMGLAVDNRYRFTQVGGDPFGYHTAEKTGADHDISGVGQIHGYLC